MPPPERWDAYCSMGQVIPGTKFIAFKVPLKEALLHSVAEKDRFSPAILVAKLGENGLTLAGVIDLTYTWKYYNKEEFLTQSIGHKKVFTKGHEVPSDAVYKEFIEAVESFNIDEKLIGVHCTHGVNRTGYLICRYMIENLNMEPQVAIDLFNKARGHNLERENYIEDLKRRKSGRPTWGLSQDACDPRSPKKRKPRWRQHKEDHPGWRQSHSQQHNDPSCGQHPSEPSMPYPSPSLGRNNDWQWTDPHRNFQQMGRSIPRNADMFPAHVPENNGFQHRNESGRFWKQQSSHNNWEFYHQAFHDRQHYSWRDPNYRQPGHNGFNCGFGGAPYQPAGRGRSNWNRAPFSQGDGGRGRPYRRVQEQQNINGYHDKYH